jgi:hypothetical protein
LLAVSSGWAEKSGVLIDPVKEADAGGGKNITFWRGEICFQPPCNSNGLGQCCQ